MAVSTILVTGATGFVGRHLVPALQAAGYPVRCGGRDPDAGRKIHPAAEWVRLDVDDPALRDEDDVAAHHRVRRERDEQRLHRGLARGGDELSFGTGARQP